MKKGVENQHDFAFAADASKTCILFIIDVRWLSFLTDTKMPGNVLMSDQSIRYGYNVSIYGKRLSMSVEIEYLGTDHKASYERNMLGVDLGDIMSRSSTTQSLVVTHRGQGKYCGIIVMATKLSEDEVILLHLTPYRRCSKKSIRRLLVI
jgi:hypothetical protein